MGTGHPREGKGAARRHVRGGLSGGRGRAECHRSGGAHPRRPACRFEALPRVHVRTGCRGRAATADVSAAAPPRCPPAQPMRGWWDTTVRCRCEPSRVCWGGVGGACRPLWQSMAHLLAPVCGSRPERLATVRTALWTDHWSEARISPAWCADGCQRIDPHDFPFFASAPSSPRRCHPPASCAAQRQPPPPTSAAPWRQRRTRVAHGSDAAEVAATIAAAAAVAVALHNRRGWAPVPAAGDPRPPRPPSAWSWRVGCGGGGVRWGPSSAARGDPAGDELGGGAREVPSAITWG